jgi:hypothetical protein
MSRFFIVALMFLAIGGRCGAEPSITQLAASVAQAGLYPAAPTL